jgi:hypothetical protein
MAEDAGDKKTEEQPDVKDGAKPVERIGVRELVGAAVVVIIALVISILASSRLNEHYTALREACENNLRDIQAAKEVYAASNEATPDAVPTEADLLPYLEESAAVAGCPAAEVPTVVFTDSYAINAITSDPVCRACPVDHSLSSSTNR